MLEERRRLSPVFPERCAGPRGAPQVIAFLHNISHCQAITAILGRKGQLHDTGEPTLGEHIYAADNPIEFSFVDMGEKSSTLEVDLAVRRDTRSDAVGIIVRPQQQVADLRMVKRRSRQEIHLVVQRPLMEIEIDRRGVTAIATEAHIPTRDRSIELDRLDVLLVGNRLGQMFMNES